MAFNFHWLNKDEIFKTCLYPAYRAYVITVPILQTIVQVYGYFSQ